MYIRGLGIKYANSVDVFHSTKQKELLDGIFPESLPLIVSGRDFNEYAKTAARDKTLEAKGKAPQGGKP